MADIENDGGDENTFIKAYEELEKSKTPIRGPEAFPLVEIVHGPKQGAWFTVAYQKEITLGRAATNSIILEDNSVSRSHVVLQSSGEGFTIRDIGSRNGTFLNGKKIQGEIPLKHKDVFKIGIYSLRFLEEATEEAYDVKEEYTPRVEDSEASADASMTGTNITVDEEMPAPEPEEVQEPSDVPEAAPPATGGEGLGESTLNEDLGKIIAKESSPAKKGARPEKEGSRSLRSLSILLLILVIFGGGGYAAYHFGVLEKVKAYFQTTEAPEVAETPGEQPKVLQPDMPAAADGQVVPIFLEVDAKPISGKIFYKGKEIGATPFKISLQVPMGIPQELSGEFFLDGINEKVTQKQSFEVKKQDDIVNIQFNPKLGTLRVAALPKEGDLYLEGQYEGQQGPAKSIKVPDVAFDTPFHLPHGQYVAEVRVPQMLEGSTSKVNAIKYRREFQLGETSPEFVIQASDEHIKTFPAEINSTPTGAELFVDGKKVGETPFKGPLPTGRHKLTFKKEGFNDFEKELSIEMNTPYSASFNLETSPAGVFVNKGRDLLRQGRHNESIEQLAEALKRNPEPTELSQIHMLLGEAFIQTKTYDQALAYYQKAGQSPEYSKVAKLGMAEAQAGLGQKDRALIQILDVFLNTKDAKIKGNAEAVFHRISPMKSVLYIATQPPGAQIMVNGNPIAQATPVILSDLMVGSYRVGIKKPGFKDYETRVTLPVSSIKPVVVKLEPGS